MVEVSTFRLYLLRAMYLLIAVGLGITIWPELLSPLPNLSSSVVRCVLVAFSLMAVLGIRYPLKVLPLLLFELLWKAIWVVVFGLPLLSASRVDPSMRDTLEACLMGVVLTPLVIPWGYVFNHYLKASGERWINETASDAR